MLKADYMHCVSYLKGGRCEQDCYASLSSHFIFSLVKPSVNGCVICRLFKKRDRAVTGHSAM
jgi:hypothetical protein